jgi:hypothetical protein
MAVQTKNPGEYKLNRLTITTPNQAFDLSPYAVKCDIFESIISPSVIAEIVVSDSTGMFSSFQLSEEKVSISFTTYDSSSPVEYELSVIDVGPAVATPNDKSLVYTLTCVSDEVLTSMTIKNTPVVIKNIECEKIIKSLLDLVHSKKPLFAEKTKGLHAYGLANITPFEGIDKVRRLAVSSKHMGSAFVFFENKAGYTFKSVEKLVEEGVKNIGDKFFVFTGVANLDNSGSMWRNILGYKVIQQGNQGVALSIGGYNNIVKRLNIETGVVDIFEQKAKQLTFLSLNNGSVTSSLEQQSRRNEDQGRATLNLYTPDQENNQLAEKYNYLPYYITQLLTTIAHITIYGDTTITIGDVITCTLPEHTGLTLGDKRAYVDDNKVSSGNYLVAKCRHMLTFGNRPQYFQSLEIIRDGIGGELPTTNLK